MKPTTENDYRQRILRVLVHIQQHLDQPQPLEDLAALAHFSPCHFHRVFRGMTGESVQAHVRRLRLERAAFRLKHGESSVTQLALEAGYEAHEAFTRSFRAMFGIPPSEFRESRRATAGAEAPSGVHYNLNATVESFTSPAREHDLNVSVEEVEPMHVVFVRHNGPYNECAPAWQKLFSWAIPMGLVGPTATTLGVCHDDPDVTPTERIRYDVCLTAPETVKPTGEIGTQQVGGGTYAVYRFVGPYDQLHAAYLKLCGQWLPQSRREARSAPAIEFYRNSPMNTPPEKLITDICLPVDED